MGPVIGQFLENLGTTKETKAVRKAVWDKTWFLKPIDRRSLIRRSTTAPRNFLGEFPPEIYIVISTELSADFS